MRGRKLLIGLLTVMLAVGMVAPAMAGPSDDLNYDGDNSAPNPYIDVDTLTVAQHPLSQGTSAEAMAGVYDDNGDWVDDPRFTVNTTSDVETGTNVNPYTFKPGHVEADFFAQFPRVGGDEEGESGDNQASALDASEWSKSGAQSSEVTISDTSVASGVDALSIATGGSFTDTDTATASYSNWTSELDSDESKRVIQLAADIDTLDAGARVEVQITDESGDYKEVIIEPDASGQDVNASVMAASTGDHVYQVKLAKLSTNGGGAWDNIESIDVQVLDGDFTGEFSWIDLEKKGKTTLAENQYNDPSDSSSDHDDFQTLYNATGTVSTHDVSTMGPDFSGATLTDVQFPAKFPASMIEGEEGNNESYLASFDNAGAYPSYDTIANISYRLYTPSYIDISYSGLDLDMEQDFPSGRYLTLGYEQGVSETGNLTDATLTDQTGSLAEMGDTINLQSNAASGTYYAVKTEVKLTESEKNAMMGSSDDSAGGGGQFADDDGGDGFLGTVWGWIAMLGTSVMVALGLKKKRG
jgi:hypothetical protein